MSERVVAYAPSPQRLGRIVSDEAAAGRQVMAAFLSAEAAHAYLGRHPYPVVGEPLNGAQQAPVAAAAYPEAPPAYPDAPPATPAYPEQPAGAAWPAPPAYDPNAGQQPYADPNAYPQQPYAQAMAPAPMTPEQVMQPITPRMSGAPGQVIACYSPRGGAGTSLLAATLASRIAMNPQLRVLLVDLDLQNGSQSYFFDVNEVRRCSVLGLKPLIDEILARCEGDLGRVRAEAGAVLSEEILLAKTFRRDNLHVLCALDDPAAIDDYADPSSHIEALMQVLAMNFDVIVLDLPNTVDMFTAPALFQADRILIVTPEDIPSQIKVARMLNLVLAPMIEAREMRIQERCFLVVNRSGKRKLEVPMPVGVAAALPDDKKFFQQFVEKHTPMSKVAGANYAKNVGTLAEFLGAGGPASTKK